MKNLTILLSIFCLLTLISSCKKDENAGKPTACLTQFGGDPMAYKLINFVAWCSKDATAWHWDFGDGQTAEGEDVNHAYSTPGNYTVTLTVTNEKGSNSKTTTVTVVANPLSRLVGVYHDLGTGTCNIGSPITTFDFYVVVGPESSGQEWGSDYGWHLDFLDDVGNLQRRVVIHEDDLNAAVVPFQDLTPFSSHFRINGSFSGDSLNWETIQDFDDGDPFSSDPATRTCEGVSVR